MNHALKATAAVLVALAMLAGCKATTAKPDEPEPPAPPPPNVAEQIIGTWRTVDTFSDRDGTIGETVTTLDFTPERWTEQNSFVYANGDVFYGRTESGTWTAGEDYIERRWSDEERTIRSVNKRFYWEDEDDRTVMFMEAWYSVSGSDRFLKYEKVSDLQIDVIGSWASPVGEHVYADREGGEFERTYALELGADGSFSFMELDEDTATGVPLWVFWMEGTYEHDPGNRMIHATVSKYTRHGREEEDPERDTFTSHVMRFAYAPTHKQDVIDISPWWTELEWNEETRTWDSDSKFPWGAYYFRFEKGRSVPFPTSAHPAVIQDIPDQEIAVGDSLKFKYADYFHDPDDNIISYGVSTTRGLGNDLEWDDEGYIYAVIHALAERVATARMYVYDAVGNRAEESFKVTVSGDGAASAATDQAAVPVEKTYDLPRPSAAD